MALTIVIGNRNDSSWSLRGWLALRMSGAAFDEILVPLGRPDTRERILQYSPTGKVPLLKSEDGDIGIPWPSPSTSPSASPRPTCGRAARRRGRWPVRFARKCTAVSPRCAASCRWTCGASSHWWNCPRRHDRIFNVSAKPGRIAGGASARTVRSCSATPAWRMRSTHRWRRVSAVMRWSCRISPGPMSRRFISGLRSAPGTTRHCASRPVVDGRPPLPAVRDGSSEEMIRETSTCRRGRDSWLRWPGADRPAAGRQAPGRPVGVSRGQGGGRRAGARGVGP